LQETQLWVATPQFQIHGVQDSIICLETRKPTGETICESGVELGTGRVVVSTVICISALCFFNSRLLGAAMRSPSARCGQRTRAARSDRQSTCLIRHCVQDTAKNILPFH